MGCTVINVSNTLLAYIFRVLLLSWRLQQQALPKRWKRSRPRHSIIIPDFRDEIPGDRKSIAFPLGILPHYDVVFDVNWERNGDFIRGYFLMTVHRLTHRSALVKSWPNTTFHLIPTVVIAPDLASSDSTGLLLRFKQTLLSFNNTKPHSANEINRTARLLYTYFTVLSLTLEDSRDKYINVAENNLAAAM